MNRAIALFFIGLLKATISMAQLPQLIINELLFNPAKDGSDYVELYNNSETSLYLNDYLLGGRNKSGEPTSMKPCSRDSLILLPGKFAVFTSEPGWLRKNYNVSPDVLIEKLTLPSLPDDEGTILIMKKIDSTIVDELRYSDKWHFSLLDKAEGVALERIETSVSTQRSSNWTSAASASGYGTPGNINSQHRSARVTSSGITVSPQVFSPGNDGRDDFTFININPPDQGYIANASIYDLSGRRVRYLLKNEILGTSNTFRWDGLDDRMQQLSSGPYIIITSIFNTLGVVEKYRNVVIVGR